MKTTSILQTAILLIIIAVVTSCSASREFTSSNPEKTSNTEEISSSSAVTETSFPLIVQPTSGVFNSLDGRSYYRDPKGYMYWKGYKNKFYLDRVYVTSVNYDEAEYAEWKKNHIK